jgi:hypothetical protein
MRHQPHGQRGREIALRVSIAFRGFMAQQEPLLIHTAV